MIATKALFFLYFVCGSIAIAVPTGTNIRVKMEWIRVPTEAFLNTIDSSKSTGNELRRKVQQLIVDKMATMQDISVTSVSYRAIKSKVVKTSNQSTAQVIFPHEARPDKFDAMRVGDKWKQQKKLEKRRGYRNYLRAFLGGHQNFEQLDLGTRSNLGVHYENGSFWMDIDLTKFYYRRINKLMVIKDKWGQTDWSQVVKTDQGIRQRVVLIPNTYQLIQFTPLTLPNDSSSRLESVAVFVKAIFTK